MYHRWLQCAVTALIKKGGICLSILLGQHSTAICVICQSRYQHLITTPVILLTRENVLMARVIMGFFKRQQDFIMINKIGITILLSFFEFVALLFFSCNLNKELIRNNEKIIFFSFLKLTKER